MATIVHITSGDLWGGAEAQLLLQLEELKVQNLEVILFNKLETYMRYSEAGINCQVFEESHGFINLFSEIKKFLPTDSMIFAHGYKELALAVLLKFSLNLKIVAVFHGLREPQRNFIANLKSQLYFTIYKLLAKLFANKVICVSDALKNSLGFNNSIVIRNCVKLPALPVANTKKKLGTPIIFMAGRLVTIKRYDLAIKAIKEVLKKTGVELQIAGDGIERSQLEQLCKELKIENHVKFLGFRKDIAELLSQSSVFLICSDSEGIPTILLEAMASGAKCIATRVGGIPEVVNSIGIGCCQLVSAGSVKEISDAICAAFTEENSIDIVQIRKSIETDFSPKRAVGELMKIVDELAVN